MKCNCDSQPFNSCVCGIVIKIDPVPKPRQTKSDKWKQRPGVMKYRAFADEFRLKCNLQKVEIKETLDVLFFMKMPDSWSEEKKDEIVGQPHTQKPDIDNLVKSVMDALLKEDSIIWKIRAEKRWSFDGAIIFDQVR